MVPNGSPLIAPVMKCIHADDENSSFVSGSPVCHLPVMQELEGAA
jgi:hypothetical protein